MSINKPHTAVINIMIEVHSLLDTGECSGQVLSPKVLEDHDIKPSFIISVSGFNMEDCLTKLKQKLKEFNDV